MQQMQEQMDSEIARMRRIIEEKLMRSEKNNA
jgi:hypothetical protein